MPWTEQPISLLAEIDMISKIVRLNKKADADADWISSMDEDDTEFFRWLKIDD